MDSSVFFFFFFLCLSVQRKKITMTCCNHCIISSGFQVLNILPLLSIQDRKITCSWTSARNVPWLEVSRFPSPPDQFSPLLPVQVLPSTTCCPHCHPSHSETRVIPAPLHHSVTTGDEYLQQTHCVLCSPMFDFPS